MDQRLGDFLAAIATTGNMTKAAQSLFVTQPYISQTVRRAENELNVVLVTRDHQPLTLTYAGQRVLTYLQAQHQLQTAMQQELKQLTNHAAGSLTLAINQPLAALWLPEILPALYAQFPQLHLNIQELTTSEAEQRLPTGKIDVFIGKAIYDHRLAFQPLGRLKLALVVPANSDIQPQAEQPLAALTNQPFIRIAAPSRFQEVVDHYFQDNGITVINRLEVPDSRIALALATAQLGSMVTGWDTAKTALKNHPDQIRIYPIPTNQVALDMGITYPAHHHSAVLTQLVQLTMMKLLPLL